MILKSQIYENIYLKYNEGGEYNIYMGYDTSKKLISIYYNQEMVYKYRLTKRELEDLNIDSPEIAYLNGSMFNNELKGYDKSKFRIYITSALEDLKYQFMELKEELEDYKSIDIKRKQEAIEDKIEYDAVEGKKLYMTLHEPFSNYLYTYYEILFPGNGKKMLMMFIQAIQTARGQPAGVILSSLPGEGKSILMEYVLETIPDEHKYQIQDATESGFFGIAKEDGTHFADKKIIYLGDLGAEDTYKNTAGLRYNLRKLMTDGYTNRYIRDREDLNNTIHEEIFGFPSMWYTTVKSEIPGQERDRSIIITPSLDQKDGVGYIQRSTRGITQSKTAKLLQTMKDEWIPIFHKIFNYMITLTYEIVLPYDLEKQGLEFRDNNKILDISLGNALLNHRWREHYERVIITREEDIELIKETLEPETDETQDKLSENNMKILRRLQTSFKDKWFTSSEVKDKYSEAFKTPKSVITILLTPAEEKGYLERNKSERQHKFRFVVDIQKKKINYSNALKKIKVDEDYLLREFGIKYRHKKPIPLGFVSDIPLPWYLLKGQS